jgi:hypothetical protein
MYTEHGSVEEGRRGGNDFVVGVERWDGDRRGRRDEVTSNDDETKQDKPTETIEQQILSNHPITSIPFLYSHAQIPPNLSSSSFSLVYTLDAPTLSPSCFFFHSNPVYISFFFFHREAEDEEKK